MSNFSWFLLGVMTMTLLTLIAADVGHLIRWASERLTCRKLAQEAQSKSKGSK